MLINSVVQTTLGGKHHGVKLNQEDMAGSKLQSLAIQALPARSGEFGTGWSHVSTTSPCFRAICSVIRYLVRVLKQSQRKWVFMLSLYPKRVREGDSTLILGRYLPVPPV